MQKIIHKKNKYFLADDDGNCISKKFDGMVMQKKTILVMEGKKFGIIDYAGKILVKAKYHTVHFLPEVGLFKVSNGKAWGLLDLDGQEVLKVAYEAVQVFKDKYAHIAIKQTHGGANGYSVLRWGAIDRTGKIVVEPYWADSLSVTAFLNSNDFKKKMALEEFMK